MYKTSRAQTPEDPAIPARPGWEGMHVHWLADRGHGGTETTVFNVTEFPPNRSHEVHRHPHAEEYFFVLEGSGQHLTDGVAHYSDAGYETMD
jgi:quercetin dioxygenase-like cupin family protein